jgi:hypothetical protein
MRKVDRDGLRLAMSMARRDPRRAAQLDAKLADGEPWVEVAERAAYGCQVDALRLKPWQPPPCRVEVGWTDGDGLGALGGVQMASELLERMLRLKISRWHPDPVAAIEAAEQARAAKQSAPA